MTLTRLRYFASAAASLALVACGGGGGGGDSPAPPAPPASNNVVSLRAVAPTDPLASNSNATFEYTITNPGSVSASNVALSVQLPATVVAHTFQCSGSTQCPADSESTSVTALAPGASIKFTMTVLFAQRVSGTGQILASVTASNDNVGTDNTVTTPISLYTAEVNVVGSTNAGEFMSGDSVPYTFTLSNAGPDASRGLTLENALSAEQTQLTFTCSASGGAICPTVGATMSVPQLPAGGALSFTVTARLEATALASASDTLTVTAQGDPNAANNHATVSARTREPTSSGMHSFVHIKSDVGDFIGGGKYYAYDGQNSAFSIEDFGADQTHFKISGDQDWTLGFVFPKSSGRIIPGSLVNVTAIPEDTFKMLFSSDGNTCVLVTGWFIVDGATYNGNDLTSLDVRFERHCEGRPPALRGQIHWVANDDDFPPGPVNPPPAGLWSAPSSSLPTSGNYIYLNDEFYGDWVGRGIKAVYTQTNSIITTSSWNGMRTFGVNGANSWGFYFKPMQPLAQLQPGYYAIADKPAPENNPARSGFSFFGDGHVCMYVEGWFVVDNAVYQNGDLVAFDARFQQKCDNDLGVTRGQIHWRSDDITQPSGPGAPPAGLWDAPASVVPATGNFVYLDSQGDFVGGGIKKLYTPLDSVFKTTSGITPAANRFLFSLDGDESWTGVFQAMARLPRLERGYYPDVIRWVGNPATGGMDVSGEGRGCNELDGWFSVDELTYVGDTVTSIDLRFEQHCEHNTPALRGRIRWSAGDTRTPLGPKVPPTGLWAPPAGVVPANINSVYLDSSAGDFVGAGKTYLYTSLNATFPISITGPNLSFEVWGDKRWLSSWTPMAPRVHLETGYYDLAQGSSIARGQMAWLGDGRACPFNDLRGWFVVDNVAYNGDALTALDLRFEQRCYATEPPLRGAIHWRADDPTVIPGPQFPIPAGLWRPPASVDPGSGNLLYIEADAADYASGGGTFRYVAADSYFDSRTYVDGSVGIGGQRSNDGFLVQLDKMASLARLQPGYYPNARRNLLHNPTVPGMEISRLSRGGCETLDGWFAIDSITYTGSDVTAIDARFEQRCNGSTAVLHGRVRWSGVSQ